jgi:AraC family transcriptional regulator
MDKIDVRIVELPAMKYVRFHGFGESPEGLAFSKMFDWAEENRYFSQTENRCFGFNNPDPTPGSNNYGYEVWLIIPENMPVGETPVMQFSGGMYAVTRCSGSMASAGEFIPSAWKNLVEWLENSPYQMGKHQWLEETLPGDDLSFPEMYTQGKMKLDLFMPISK